MIGADGGTGGSGVANGAPDSQSHNERLSGRRAKPSHDGGPFDQIAQPPSCHAMIQMMNSRRHIVLMPLLDAPSLALAISRTRVHADRSAQPTHPQAYVGYKTRGGPNGDLSVSAGCSRIVSRRPI